MPMIYYRKDEKIPLDTITCRQFDALDKIVREQVIPEFWDGKDKYYKILPNSHWGLDGQGPTKDKDPKKYFACACLQKGILIAETGIWLDNITLNAPMTDGKDRELIINLDKQRIDRLDKRRPIYRRDGYLMGLIGISRA